jgi:hypothetical protein
VKLHPGFLEALRRAHDAVADIGAALLVAAAVDGVKDLGAELAALDEHLVDERPIDLGVPWHLAVRRLDIEQFMQDELHLADRRVVLGHVKLLSELK